MLKSSLFLAILIITMVFIPSNAQTTNIPDANFEKALIDLGIDTDGVVNGTVATADVIGITSLDVSDKNISILTGIQDFVSLTELFCQKNLLQSLTLSANTKMTILDCSENNLTTLKTSDLIDLKILDCGSNQITEINLSNNVNLNEFYIDHNLLTTLNLKDNLELTAFDCSYNQFQVLNITFNWKLESLNFSHNLLETIDLSNCVRVTYLDCSNNPLNIIFLNNMTQLKEIYMADNDFLTFVNFSHNYQLEKINCKDNDLLTGLDLIGTDALKYLHAGNNKLLDLNISKNEFLESLYVHNNLLTSLDISANPAIAFLKCNDNKLESLNLKNGFNTLMTGGFTIYDDVYMYMNGMNATNNPSLQCIQVDDENNANNIIAPYDSWLKDETVIYSEDCAAALAVDEQILDNSMLIYPNPVTEILHIETKQHQISRIDIYSVLGNKIKEVDTNFDAIVLPDLPHGVYFIRIHFEEGWLVKTILKN